MTIALGIHALDGDSIVVAADTQETMGDMKSSQPKIVTVLSVQLGQGSGGYPQSGVCAITGAGDSGYVDSLTSELAEVFLGNITSIGKDLQHRFGQCVKDFYKDHVVPFGTFPLNHIPEVEMLMAVQRSPVSMLLATDRSTIRMVSPYHAVGAGAALAKVLFNRLWRPANTKDTQILAAYIAFLVKESIEGCGKFTQVTTLYRSTGAPPQAVSTLPWQYIDDLERDFRTKWAVAEQGAIWDLIRATTIGGNERS